MAGCACVSRSASRLLWVVQNSAKLSSVSSSRRCSVKANESLGISATPQPLEPAVQVPSYNSNGKLEDTDVLLSRTPTTDIGGNVSSAPAVGSVAGGI